MENLVTKWGNLSLDDREGGEVQLNENESSKNVTIAAKFLTKRALSTEAVIRTFNPIWRPKNGFIRCVTWVTISSYSFLTMRKR